MSSDFCADAQPRRVQVSYPEVKKGKTKKSKAREEEAAMHAASLAASLAAQEGGHVKTYSISPAGVVSEQTGVSVASHKPRVVFGGPLLAVVSSKTITKGATELRFLGLPGGWEDACQHPLQRRRTRRARSDVFGDRVDSKTMPACVLKQRV